MSARNPLDEVTSSDFILDALLVCLIICIIGLAAFVFASLIEADGLVTKPAVEKVPECHVYYHQHNQTHQWKGVVK
ncbi:MAG: hypothetical protein Q8S71_03885 [Hydrogenophaga sp.]|nr:hypothetical protein [Hydrogenophaga sp.]